MSEERNLDYLEEVTPGDVKGLFFMDYSYNEGDMERVIPRWVRSPFVDSRSLTIRLATLDFSRVERLRIQCLERLIVPVNEIGLSDIECDQRDMKFEPYCQYVEYIFGSRYRIDAVNLEAYREGRREFQCEKGLYTSGGQDGLVVADLSEVATPFVGSENANQNSDTDYVLLDVSTLPIKEVKEVAERYTEKGFGHYSLLEYLLKESIDDLLSDPDPRWNPALSETIKFFNFMKDLEGSAA